LDFTEYKEASHLRYGEFAKAISGILAAAIHDDGGYRLQLIKERAKAPNSLHKKLLDRSMLDSRSLETDIKDLAGSRVVFYTDIDVAKFLSSGIVEGNFEVVDRKVHYPARDSEDATELYISSHFVIKLTDQRLALPEYAKFAGMQCEVQVQTILNHSWSEMAHDTIYKMPPLAILAPRVSRRSKSAWRKWPGSIWCPRGTSSRRSRTTSRAWSVANGCMIRTRLAPS